MAKKRRAYDVECPQCKSHLIVRMQRKHEGKEVEVKCHECNHLFDRTITRADLMFNAPPAGSKPANPLLLEFSKALYDTVIEALNSSEVLGAQTEKLKQAGYEPSISVGFEVGLVRIGGELREPTPLVKDGHIVPGAFSKEDQDEFRALRISLGNE